MVLNNDKWDKKAKRQYMIKHGIKPTQTKAARVRAHFVQNKFDQQIQSSDEEESQEEYPELGNISQQQQDSKGAQSEDPDDNNEVEEEAEGEEDTSSLLQTNTWRYKDLPEESTDDYSDDIIKRLASIKLKNIEKKHNINKLSSSELLRLKIGSTDQECQSSEANSHIKTMTPEEQKAFDILQEKANKQKHYQQIKFKFSAEATEFEKQRHKAKEGKVLDLTDKDSYNDKLAKKFQSAQRGTRSKVTDIEFDQDLADLLGDNTILSPTPTAPKENDVMGNDVDKLLNDLADLDMMRPSSISSINSNTARVNYKPKEEDESFLEELL